MKIQKKQEIEFFGTKTGNANSIALGYATETKNFGEVAVGIMNKSTAAKDPNSPKGVCVDPDATLFSVGYGGSGERKNALEVKGDGSVMVSGKNGDINVADKIKQALDTDASIKLVRSAENNLQYTLMVNDEPRGSIDIPKDQFLKNVTYDSEGKQLVFTFVTLDEDEHVEKVPVGDLKDVYKAGEGITINGDNVISADFSSVMTAISDEKTQRETTDNEIKSTLDTKADASAIPTKTSQLTNDSYYATTTPSGILAVAGLTVRNNAQIRYIQKTNGEKGTYLIAETPADRVANKVFAADGSLFDVGENLLQIGHPADNVDTVGLGTIHIVHNKLSSTTQLQFSDENISYEDVVKLHTLPSITGKLSNITAATTTEDMITKFNDLLADLKAKGYMTADVTT